MNKKFHLVIEKAGQVVLDKKEELYLSTVCLLAGGHLLIEDVPGVGKTTLVQALGKLTGLDTRRIQFTVDLLPADIIGSQVFHPETRTFEFHPGPIFSQLVLTDELNRASPRTQSALLQAMEESEVTVDGKTIVLPKPFHVIATQNPHQQTGTFPLPESQLDRFLMSLELNYASKETELALFVHRDPKERLAALTAVLSGEDLLKAQEIVSEVKVASTVAEYVGRLLEKSRNDFGQALPLSTRSGLALIKASKARAFLEGRDYLRVEDVQFVLVSVFGHRLGGSHGLRKGREWAEQLRKETAVPV